MALVIIAIISKLHLGGKLVSRPSKYPERRFSSIIRSNIEM